MGAVFNAAKEAALDAFLSHRVRFTEMSEVVTRVLDSISGDAGLPRLSAGGAMPSLEDVLEADRLARGLADGIVGGMRG